MLLESSNHNTAVLKTLQWLSANLQCIKSAYLDPHELLLPASLSVSPKPSNNQSTPEAMASLLILKYTQVTMVHSLCALPEIISLQQINQVRNVKSGR